MLAEGVTELVVSEARDAWHVAVRATDEEEVHAALHSRFARDARPRLKDRFLVPDDVSLFADVSMSGASHGMQSADSQTFTAEEQDIVVNRTFLHVPTMPCASPRTSVSAPPGL